MNLARRLGVFRLLPVIVRVGVIVVTKSTASISFIEGPKKEGLGCEIVELA